jgi:putative colanic acid biosynthesis acetyltransferase WcaF
VENKATDLSKFKHELHLSFGAKLKYGVWLVISNIFFLTNIPYPSSVKVYILRLLGAQIGQGCVIKPWVKIKLPWNLYIGDNVWLGESVWIDNISNVRIGSNVCISQKALLITGNHDYSLPYFDLISKPIHVEEGVWICANSTITGGVTLKSHSVVGIGVIIKKDTSPFSIYGNKQEVTIKQREIK